MIDWIHGAPWPLNDILTVSESDIFTKIQIFQKFQFFEFFNFDFSILFLEKKKRKGEIWLRALTIC